MKEIIHTETVGKTGLLFGRLELGADCKLLVRSRANIKDLRTEHWMNDTLLKLCLDVSEQRESMLL